MSVQRASVKDTVNILIVEDSLTQQEKLKHLLEQHNYSVMTANNGKQALALLSAHKPALVISDIVMPEMDGYAFCKQLKSDKSSQNIPVILLTSLSNSEDVLEGLACGADNFITKPYDDDYLISGVRQILANKDLYGTKRVRVGVEITFAGKKRFITADQQQIFSLLLSTYEAAVSRNTELLQTQEELRSLNDRLEDLVEYRTKALSSEIDEHKQAENKLQYSFSLLRAIFDSTPDGILVVNQQGETINFNKRFQEMWSIPESLVSVGDDEKLFEYVCNQLKEPEVFLAGVKKLYSHPEAKSYDLLEFKDGRIFERYSCPQITEKESIGRIWNFRDITERKQAEEERKSLLEQLVRSEKLAAVGELIAGVAHEINNPLTGIVGLSELLLRENKENLDEDTKKDLKSIYESSERIKKIVANLLRFARREAPARKDVSVNELLGTVLSIRDYEMKVKNVELKKNYQLDLPPVMADSSQLEQVFLNLITNAEYAIHETGKAGTLTISTSLQEEQPEHQKVIIEISDTGAGIPEDALPKLFNPFFTTKPVGKGTGLGLSVSYGIIKEHGGEISACNRAEGGAVFTIKLPVRGGVNE